MTRQHHPSNAELREEAERQLLLATIRLARALNNKTIQAATLKDRAAALGVTADRFLKFAAAPDESDDRVQLVFEGEEPTDADHHHAQEAARGPETDLGEPGALQGFGLWPTLRQNRAWQTLDD